MADRILHFPETNDDRCNVHAAEYYEARRKLITVNMRRDQGMALRGFLYWGRENDYREYNLRRLAQRHARGSARAAHSKPQYDGDETLSPEALARPGRGRSLEHSPERAG